MKRHASLKRTPSHAEERKLMEALKRVPYDHYGMHAADAPDTPSTPAGDNESELEPDDAYNNELEGSKIGGMSLKERRALWESTLPQKSNVLPVRPQSNHELAKLANATWIEADDTPTVPYQESGRKPAKPEKTARLSAARLPW